MWSIDKYQKAWQFACKAHKGQLYPSSEENEQVAYIDHIGTVVAEIICALQTDEKNYDLDLAIQTALLHDVIEDTKVSYDDIVENFGVFVADGVLGLTKNKTLPYEYRMIDSIERIKRQSKEIWAVKLADRISNLQKPPFDWSNEKIKSYRDEAIYIYENLKECNACLANRLSNKIDNYLLFLK